MIWACAALFLSNLCGFSEEPSGMARSAVIPKGEESDLHSVVYFDSDRGYHVGKYVTNDRKAALAELRRRIGRKGYVVYYSDIWGEMAPDPQKEAESSFYSSVLSLVRATSNGVRLFREYNNATSLNQIGYFEVVIGK